MDQRRSACDRCRGFKLRCERSEQDPTRCKRCMRSKTVCVVSVEHRVGQSASKPLPKDNTTRFVFAENYTVDPNSGLSTNKITGGEGDTPPSGSDSSGSGNHSSSSSVAAVPVNEQILSLDHLFSSQESLSASGPVRQVANRFYQPSPSPQAFFDAGLNDFFSSFIDNTTLPLTYPAKRLDPLPGMRAKAYDALTKLQADLHDAVNRVKQSEQYNDPAQNTQARQVIPVKLSQTLMTRFLDLCETLKQDTQELNTPQRELEAFAFDASQTLGPFGDSSSSQISTQRRSLLDMPSKMSLLTCLIYLSRLYREIFGRVFAIVRGARTVADLACLDMPEITFGEVKVGNMPILQLNVFMEVCIRSWNRATNLIGFKCVNERVVGGVPGGILSDDSSFYSVTAILTDEVAAQEAEFGSPTLKDVMLQLPVLLDVLQSSQLSFAQSMLQGRPDASTCPMSE